MFNWEVLDVVEVGVERYLGLEDIPGPKKAMGSVGSSMCVWVNVNVKQSNFPNKTTTTNRIEQTEGNFQTKPDERLYTMHAHMLYFFIYCYLPFG